MTTEIIIPAFLQPFTSGVNLVNVNGETLRTCLEELTGLFPGLQEKIFIGNGKLHNGINLFVNGERADPADLEKSVQDGDKIHIAYVTVGG